MAGQQPLMVDPESNDEYQIFYFSIVPGVGTVSHM